MPQPRSTMFQTYIRLQASSSDGRRMRARPFFSPDGQRCSCLHEAAANMLGVLQYPKHFDGEFVSICLRVTVSSGNDLMAAKRISFWTPSCRPLAIPLPEEQWLTLYISVVLLRVSVVWRLEQSKSSRVLPPHGRSSCPMYIVSTQPSELNNSIIAYHESRGG